MPLFGKLLLWGLVGWGVYKVGSGLYDHFFPEGTGDGQGTAQTGGCDNVQGMTWTKKNIQSFADGIEAALWYQFYGTVEDDLAVAAILKQMRSTGDITALICEYGVRGSMEEKYNLPQSITSYLDEDLKAAVNLYYVGKGINWQW